jgi:hypothetical protein
VEDGLLEDAVGVLAEAGLEELGKTPSASGSPLCVRASSARSRVLGLRRIGYSTPRKVIGA